VCRNYSRGTCRLGNKCSLHHGGSPQRGDSAMDIDDRPQKRKRDIDGGANNGKKSTSRDELDDELNLTAREREIRSLREENSSLRSDNASLRLENTQLRSKLEKLTHGRFDF